MVCRYLSVITNYLAEEVDVGQGVLVAVEEVGAGHPPCNHQTATYHGLRQILQKIYCDCHQTVQLSNNHHPVSYNQHASGSFLNCTAIPACAQQLLYAGDSKTVLYCPGTKCA